MQIALRGAGDDVALGVDNGASEVALSHQPNTRTTTSRISAPSMIHSTRLAKVLAGLAAVVLLAVCSPLARLP